MKTVLIRFEARGSSSKILVWLLSWMHCIPMSMMMIPAMIPIKVFSPMKNSNQAKRINPQPIKLKRRTPTCFTYLPTKDAVYAPATPQSPSIPITSLLAKNGACPILKARQDHMARREPKFSAARIE